jgi:hypothetical protein
LRQIREALADGQQLGVGQLVAEDRQRRQVAPVAETVNT